MNDLELLDAYMNGEMEGSAAEAFEEDLFARAAEGNASDLAFVDGLRASVRELVEHGTYDLYLTAAEVERLRASGAKVQFFELLPTPQEQHYAIDRDADFTVARCALDLKGVRSLDIEVWVGDHLSKVMRDVRFDPADGAAFLCCEGELARATAGVLTRSRIWATDASGERRLLAELQTLGELGI